MFSAIAALEYTKILRQEDTSDIDAPKKDLAFLLVTEQIKDVNRDEFYAVLRNPNLQSENALKLFANKIEGEHYRLPKSIIQLIDAGEEVKVSEVRMYLKRLNIILPDVDEVINEELIEKLKNLEELGDYSLDSVSPMLIPRLVKALKEMGLNSKDIRLYGHLSRSYMIDNLRGIGNEKFRDLGNILSYLGVNFIERNTPSDSIISRSIMQPRPGRNPITVAQAFQIFNITGKVYIDDIVRDYALINKKIEDTSKAGLIPEKDFIQIYKYLAELVES